MMQERCFINLQRVLSSLNDIGLHSYKEQVHPLVVSSPTKRLPFLTFRNVMGGLGIVARATLTKGEQNTSFIFGEEGLRENTYLDPSHIITVNFHLTHHIPQSLAA
ncbi:hypothetical protein CDAR_102271 [Caerostris darwini]|uniref:Uncharacterized protein n=1 Tax=Caerostris darwini TaxID=1538125 RepID=A0AAV4RPI8_9ARAC|nr:hypothetical protein CDAR_102271 [Caerostris darwini]